MSFNFIFYQLKLQYLGLLCKYLSQGPGQLELFGLGLDWLSMHFS